VVALANQLTDLDQGSSDASRYHSIIWSRLTRMRRVARSSRSVSPRPASRSPSAAASI